MNYIYLAAMLLRLNIVSMCFLCEAFEILKCPAECPFLDFFSFFFLRVMLLLLLFFIIQITQTLFTFKERHIKCVVVVVFLARLV